MKDRVIVITGPTAAGKSAVALELCRSLGGEIVNADAMQIYRGMDIGTAKASHGERAEIPHHLIDIRTPSESYSVADYVQDASLAIREIHRRERIAGVCGGTGLYVQSLMEGIQFHPHSSNPEVRRELEEQADREGVAALRLRLQEIDPETAGRLTDGDRRRVIRALEMVRTTGSTPTDVTRAIPAGRTLLCLFRVFVSVWSVLFCTPGSKSGLTGCLGLDCRRKRVSFC
jgi:tRNA dimethylallyltransferase